MLWDGGQAQPTIPTRQYVKSSERGSRINFSHEQVLLGLKDTFTQN